ncbi:MAG: hypothetical protein AAF544_13635 [Bacteroidota bacterium]
MHIHLSTLLCLVFSTLLAQNSRSQLGFQENATSWQIGGGFYWPIESAAIVHHFSTDQRFSRCFSNSGSAYYTITHDNQTYEYCSSGARTKNARERSSWYGAKLKVVRQFRDGVFFHGDLFYTHANYDSAPHDLSFLIGADGAYVSSSDTSLAGGIQIGLGYTLWRNKRFQATISISLGIASYEHRSGQKIFHVPLLNYEEDFNRVPSYLFVDTRPNRISGTSRSINTQIGLRYRLLPTLSVGIEYWDDDTAPIVRQKFLGLEFSYWIE